MQQVNLPKTKNTQKGDNKSSASNTAITNDPNINPIKQAPPKPRNPRKDSNDSKRPNDPWGNDPWGSSWDDPWGDKSNDRQKKKLSPQERTEMIQKVYQEVLGREADTRDINYYKYSTLEEEEIFKQVLSGKEHKQLIQDGREFKTIKSRAEQAETRIKSLEAQIRDQVVEFRQLTELLQEKNRYINQLRNQSQNPYNFVGDSHTKVAAGHTHYSQPTAPKEQLDVPEERPSEHSPHASPQNQQYTESQQQNIPQTSSDAPIQKQIQPQAETNIPIQTQPQPQTYPQPQSNVRSQAQPQFNSPDLANTTSASITTKSETKNSPIKNVLTKFVKWVDDIVES